jgi:F-type H+-transporting ATPase subunit b
MQSRPLQRLFSVAALVLALGIMVGSSHVAAQEPTATPAHSTASSRSHETADAANAETGKAEENEKNEYRHAPVVQTIARLLHLDVETAARLFEIINATVIILLILIPLARVMPKLLRKRTEKVRSDLESARKVTQDANARLSAVEAKLSSLGDEIAKFRTEVEQQILLDEQRGKAALEEESARIVAAAEQEISVAAAQAKRTLRHFAADLAIDRAAKQLVLTPEADRALISEFIGEAAKGGQN